VSKSSGWKIVFLVGLATYGIGALGGFLADRSKSNIFNFLFLGGIVIGSIVSLVAYVALALTTRASSAIAGGAISLFLTFFVPMAFEHFGVPVNIHDSAGIVFIAFGTIAGLGGILLLVIGVARIASLSE
jgi:hypothetical protein